MSKQVKVRKISSAEEMNTAHAIRRKVFVVEQGCPQELEFEHDEEAIHFLASIGDVACGAARWRRTPDGYKLERFAVLKEFRRRGVGAALLRAVLADLPDDHRPRYLNGQVEAVPFYLTFHFQPHGDLFEEAGIIHRKMILRQ